MRVKKSALARIASPSSFAIVKSAAEKRYVLGVVYPAGHRDHLVKGADGRLDVIGPEALEKAAWDYLRGGAKTGVLHETRFGLPRSDEATVVESYIWRGPDWHVQAGGREVVVKAGDWLLGAILSEKAWDAAKRGVLDGWSPQGFAHRRAIRE